MYGILFDLDGTLLDTLEDLADSVNYALEQHGYPQRTLEEIRTFVGNGAAMLIKLATSESEDYEQVLRTFQSYYKTHCQVKTGPYTGILDVLKEIRAEYPVAVVSNKPDPAVKILCADYFGDVFALGEHAGCTRKPAPDMLYKAMEHLGVDKAVYVGDSEVDVITAKNAGIPCLSVLWGFRDREDMEAVGAEYFCEDPLTLAESLEALLSRLGLDGNS